MDDISFYQAQILDAVKNKQHLRIRGKGSKDFYGQILQGNLLDMTSYTGIIDYEPTELVITARAGTPLIEIKKILKENNQMLAFDPPDFEDKGTLGGAIATGLSGPRRPYAGAARDFVLGIRMLDGNANNLSFGGQVIKNVAGFDVSRLMVGALGTLGLLLEISLKVIPRPQAELTLCFEMNETDSIQIVNEWSAKGLPLSATCFHNGLLTIRLSGAEQVIHQKHREIGGDKVQDGDAFWNSIQNHSATFFTNLSKLWRVSVPSTTPIIENSQLIEWGGGLRWVSGELDESALRNKVSMLGGHVTLFRAENKVLNVFHPLTNSLNKLHQRIKHQFDPHRIFNIQRMYLDY